MSLWTERRLHLIAGVLWVFLCPGTSPLVAQSGPLWVAEAGVNVRQLDDGFEVEGNRGWLRLNAVYADFEAAFDVAFLDPRSTAAVSFYAWPGDPLLRGSPYYGYHLVAASNGIQRLESAGVPTPRTDQVDPSAPPGTEDGWQRWVLTVQHGVATVRINGSVARTYLALGELSGYLAIQPRRGKLRFRNVVVSRISNDGTAFTSARRMPSPSEVLPEAQIERFVMPVLKRQVRPRYPKDMLSQKIEGVVSVEGSFRPTGSSKWQG